MAKLSGQAKIVLAALEAGRRLERMGDAWRSGAMVATAAAVGELMRHDLVREDAGALILSGAGHGHAARNAAEGGANRLLASRGTGGSRVTVNRAEAPLGWLKARGLVSDRQYAAGERLHGDWTAAQLAPRVTMRWDATPAARGARGPGGAVDPTVAQIAARRRFEAAVAAAGAGMGDVAWRVICAGEGLETAEKALGWPKRAGRVVLLLALDRLADHYVV